jgi:elongation factor Ts
MGLGRFAKYEISGEGVVGSYIHMAGRVGVLAEITCGKAETASSQAVADFAKDLCMHIAAAHPICVRRDEVPTDKVEAERDIFREQMKGKPAEIIEKIIDGKLGKFYSINCLLDQPFIKDNDKTIQALLDDLSKAAGDTVTVTRFSRYAVGEES